MNEDLSRSQPVGSRVIGKTLLIIIGFFLELALLLPMAFFVFPCFFEGSCSVPLLYELFCSLILLGLNIFFLSRVFFNKHSCLYAFSIAAMILIMGSVIFGDNILSEISKIKINWVTYSSDSMPITLEFPKDWETQNNLDNLRIFKKYPNGGQALIEVKPVDETSVETYAKKILLETRTDNPIYFLTDGQTFSELPQWNINGRKAIVFRDVLLSNKAYSQYLYNVYLMQAENRVYEIRFHSEGHSNGWLHKDVVAETIVKTIVIH